MKLLIFAFLCIGSFARAATTEITPGTLVGSYKVSARALFKELYANIYVVNTHEFEFERTYPDGRKDSRCQGTYTLTGPRHNKVLQGYGTCPDDRQKKLDFRLEFLNKSMEDLERGTMVQVKSSLSGGLRVNANVKRQ